MVKGYRKYKAKPVVIDGIRFDSTKEGQRYIYLKAQEKAGKIKNLRLQVPYELIPPQRRNGKSVERAVKYYADFVYTENGVEVVEDTKGAKTPDYIIKRKLMLYIHDIKINEV